MRPTRRFSRRIPRRRPSCRGATASFTWCTSARCCRPVSTRCARSAAAWSALRSRDPRSAERLRLHFVGTSNQRAGGMPRAITIASSTASPIWSLNIPIALDYFDALATLRAAHAVLADGQPRTTLHAEQTLSGDVERPAAACRVSLREHRDGTADRFGRAPAVRLITYDDAQPVAARVDRDR